MAIQDWSDSIYLVELSGDPDFGDDLSALLERMAENPKNVAINFSAVGFVNSSNIAKLLRLRKQMLTSDMKLVLCGLNSQVWGMFLVTGLDKIFDFTKDVSTALMTLQGSEDA